MIKKCINWIKKSTQRADEYYRAMTTWVISRRSKGSVKGLIKLATAYDNALDKALICLRKLRRTDAVESEIANTKDYKALILDDLKFLNNAKE